MKHMVYIQQILLGLFLLPLVIEDIKTGKINMKWVLLHIGITISILIVVLSSMYVEPFTTALSILMGVIPGMGMLLWAKIAPEKVGEGDGWALLVCGLYLGGYASLELFWLSCFCFLAGTLVLSGIRHQLVKQQPFMPYIAAGYGVWLLIFR